MLEPVREPEAVFAEIEEKCQTPRDPQAKWPQMYGMLQSKYMDLYREHQRILLRSSSLATPMIPNLMAEYAGILNQYGPDSEESQKYIENLRENNPDLVSLAELARSLKIALTAPWPKSEIEIVHVLDAGHALCGFPGIPNEWPESHKWVNRRYAANDVNCKKCREIASKIQ